MPNHLASLALALAALAILPSPAFALEDSYLPSKRRASHSALARYGANERKARPARC